MSTTWGRVAEDGTVYLRTADGERAVGSWLAGPPEEGLAYYERRYDDLAADVALLEQRHDTDLAAVRRLRASLATANVIGDLDALAARLDTLLARAAARDVERAAERAAGAEQALAAKQALVAEAQQLAASTTWKQAGDRLRAIGDEWRAIKGVDRKADTALWQQVTAARDLFGKRRSAHFAALDEKREAAGVRKEALVKEAEALSGSREWADTATRYKALMAEWKAAGPAPRQAEDALWTRFRAAQDAFFARRSEVYAERDAEFRGNQERKEALLTEAEALDPAAAGTVQRLRELQERWDAVGKVPREVMQSLEQRMGAVEDRVRGVTEARWEQADPPLVVKLRQSIADLERKVDQALAAGRAAEADACTAKLTTQREWLAQAESST